MKTISPYLLTAALSLAFAGASWCQTTAPAQPRAVFKFAPLSLIGVPLSSFTFGFEHRLAPRLYANHAGGIAIPSGWVDLPPIERLQAYRWQSGLRIYVRPFDGQSSNSYFELHGKYVYTDMDIQGDFCRFDCAFQQRITYRRLEKIFSVLMSTGATMAFSHRLRADIDCGIGYQRFSRTFENVPPDANSNGNGSFFFQYDNDKKTDRVDVSFRLMLGYVLW